VDNVFHEVGYAFCPTFISLSGQSASLYSVAIGGREPVDDVCPSICLGPTISSHGILSHVVTPQLLSLDVQVKDEGAQIGASHTILKIANR